MIFPLRYWAVALLSSAALHIAASLYFQPDSQVVQIDGTAGKGDVLLLGETSFESVASGETDGEETAEETDVLEPVSEQALAPLEKQEAPLESVMGETVQSDSDVIEAKPAPPETPLEAPQTTENPSKTIESVQPRSQDAVAALSVAIDPIEESEPLIDAPVPTPRPDYVKPAPRKQTAKTSSPPAKKKTAKAAPKKGDAGNSKSSASKSASAGTGKKRATEAGNAAVANYTGKVQRKISQLRRSLRKAAGGARRMKASVAFTVMPNGSAVSIRITASSGSPAFDAAVVQLIQRAAPFPPIPAGAGRNKWPFRVPIVFER